MRKLPIALALLATLSMGACGGLMPGGEPEAEAVPTDVVAPDAGPTALTAAAITGDPTWIVFAALDTAASGDLVAQNDASGDCAFANGDGTFTAAPCA